MSPDVRLAAVRQAHGMPRYLLHHRHVARLYETVIRAGASALTTGRWGDRGDAR
jgi:hypothetical protein